MRPVLGRDTSNAFRRTQSGICATTASVFIEVRVQSALEGWLDRFVAPAGHDSVVFTVTFIEVPAKDARDLHFNPLNSSNRIREAGYNDGDEESSNDLHGVVVIVGKCNEGSHCKEKPCQRRTPPPL